MRPLRCLSTEILNAFTVDAPFQSSNNYEPFLVTICALCFVTFRLCKRIRILCEQQKPLKPRTNKGNSGKCTTSCSSIKQPWKIAI